jgi:hypothetical protein
MNLYVAYPQRSANVYLRIEKVGAAVAIMQARVNDLNRAPIGGFEPS